MTERFYRDISDLAVKSGSKLNSFLSKFVTGDGALKNMCKMVIDPKIPIKLNQFDRLLSNSEIRAAIYDELEIKESDLPYPVDVTNKASFIYGYLSNQVHSPETPILWLRNDEDGEVRTYAEFLATRYRMKVGLYDAESAAAGEEEFLSEMPTTANSLGSSGKSTGTSASVPPAASGSFILSALVQDTNVLSSIGAESQEYERESAPVFQRNRKEMTDCGATIPERSP